MNSDSDSAAALAPNTNNGPDADAAAYPALLTGHSLVRTHGTYLVVPCGDPATLAAFRFRLDEPDIVPLSALGDRVRALMTSVMGTAASCNGGNVAVSSPGLFVSSTEVIEHLRVAGIGIPKVERSAPRIAIVTTVMVKAKANPVHSHTHFFVGVARVPPPKADECGLARAATSKGLCSVDLAASSTEEQQQQARPAQPPPVQP